MSAIRTPLIARLLPGRRTVVLGATVATLAMAGVAAAGAGVAPWSGAPRAHLAESAPTSLPADPQPTDEPAPTATVAGEPASGAGEPASGASEPASGGEPAADGTVAGGPLDEPTPPASSEPQPGDASAPTDPSTPNDPPASADAAPTLPGTEPPTTEPTESTEPTQPASAEPSSTIVAPPTTAPRVDTPVPEGIVLSCTASGSTVTCTWSGGVVPGFARFLVLRGDGSSRGRVPFQSSNPDTTSFVDTGVPAGSYSYVVVSVDGNSKNLVHSNPQFVQIPANG